MQHIGRRAARTVQVLAHVDDYFAQFVDNRRFLALHHHAAELHGRRGHQPLAQADRRDSRAQRGEPAGGPVAQGLGPQQVTTQRDVGQRKGAIFGRLGVPHHGRVRQPQQQDVGKGERLARAVVPQRTGNLSQSLAIQRAGQPTNGHQHEPPKSKLPRARSR